MPTTVSFPPSTINLGIAEPGGTAVGISQSAPVISPVNVTAKISADTSGGAIILVSVTSWLLEFELRPPAPPGRFP